MGRRAHGLNLENLLTLALARAVVRRIYRRIVSRLTEKIRQETQWAVSMNSVARRACHDGMSGSVVECHLVTKG